MYKIHEDDSITNEELVHIKLLDETVGLFFDDVFYEYEIFEIMHKMKLVRLLSEIIQENEYIKRQYLILFDIDVFENGIDTLGYAKNEKITIWFDFIRDNNRYVTNL